MEIRQADTAAIARNFAESNPNILMPQIDWSGLDSGYVEADLQVYPFIVSLLYRIISVHEWLGKSLSLIFSCLTAVYVFRFGRKIGDRRFALISTAVFFILPLEFFYGSAFMSEALLLLCLIAALFHFNAWIELEPTEKDRVKGIYHYSISLISLSIAASIKLPALVIGLPLLSLSYQRFGWRFFYQKLIIIYSIIALGIPFAYYLQAHQIYLTCGKTFWLHGYGIWLDPAQLTNSDFWVKMIAKVLSSRPLTYGGFALFISGIFIGLKKHNDILLFWIVGIIISFFVVASGNFLHDHYQMSLMLPAVFFIARSIEYVFYPANQIRIFKLFIIGAILLLLIQSGYKQIAFMHEAAVADPKIELARHLNVTLPANAKLITLDEDSPLTLYYAHRQGWVEPPSVDELEKAKELQNLIFVSGEKGAVHSYLNTIPFQSNQIALPDTFWGVAAQIIL